MSNHTSHSQRLFRVLSLTLFVGAALWLAVGCGPSSPRFGVPPKKEGTKEPSRRDSPAKKPASESTRETEPASGRDFRAERATALTPLEQSKLMREISKYMGVPYKLGGETRAGMDCSGYTKVVFKNGVNIELPRAASDQAKLGTIVPFDQLKFGDLIFFNTSGESASHVGIYLGDDLFAHASVSLGVTISSLQTPYFKDRYEFARRLFR